MAVLSLIIIDIKQNANTTQDYIIETMISAILVTD